MQVLKYHWEFIIYQLRHMFKNDTEKRRILMGQYLLKVNQKVKHF